jgi:hypothetical protein
MLRGAAVTRFSLSISEHGRHRANHLMLRDIRAIRGYLRGLSRGVAAAP